ncbi:MAG: tail fiber protein [Bacteroidota bacterium]
MAEPFVGEIRQWAGNFAPVGWSLCDGSLLDISQYDVLFNLIGTTYGGDGQQTFSLPNLMGRVPVSQGNGYVLGQSGGSEQVTLIQQQLPAHTHVPLCNSTGSADTPGGNVWATATNAQAYGPAPGTAGMNAAAIASVGNNQPHENRIPFQAITYIIAYEGIYPSQG